jgi:murein DD-endopeptidase MepM/ murein hydrolase activator NlpD
MHDLPFILHHLSFIIPPKTFRRTKLFYRTTILTSMNWKTFLSKIHFRMITAKEVVEFSERMIARWRQVIEKAQHTYYRITIMNNDTFEEMGAYRLSLMNVYVWTSSILVGLTLLVSAAIVLTPLKKYLPGYGGVSGRAIYALSDQLDALERKTKAQDTYNKQFKKLLVGEVESIDKIPMDFDKIPDSLMEIDPSEVELALRQKVSAGSFFPKDPKDTPTRSALAASFAGNSKENAMVLNAPVAGTISLEFGVNQKHFGMDIVAPKNAPVMAAADGFVVMSDWTQETGNTICIQHVNNMVTFYKHNERNLKKVGDKVKMGEAIAVIGNTGEQTSGPHLHFELWQNGLPLNPKLYIKF